MPLTGEYEPTPWEPVANQVADYERTDGVEGSDFMGGACIILTSLGAKSGKIRKTPLIRVTDGASYAVIGSMGGAPTSPQWVHNLVAKPRVELQDLA
ncbi:MAG: nitroreductase/quinone reductase family protein [Aquihabitans sp.]